jgi:Fungal fucose-specific lectin
VYYLNSNSELQELFYSSATPSDGGGVWTVGSLNAAHIKVAKYSDIAVFVLDDSTRNLQVNLYAQQVNNVIQEYQLNGESKQHPSRVHVALLS